MRVLAGLIAGCWLLASIFSGCPGLGRTRSRHRRLEGIGDRRSGENRARSHTPITTSNGLAFTGTNSIGMAALALLLLMLGSLALLVGARRREV